MTVTARRSAPGATESKNDDPRGRSTGIKKFGGYAVHNIFAMIYLYPFALQIATSMTSDAQAAFARGPRAGTVDSS